MAQRPRSIDILICTLDLRPAKAILPACYPSHKTGTKAATASADVALVDYGRHHSDLYPKPGGILGYTNEAARADMHTVSPQTIE